MRGCRLPKDLGRVSFVSTFFFPLTSYQIPDSLPGLRRTFAQMIYVSHVKKDIRQSLLSEPISFLVLSSASRSLRRVASVSSRRFYRLVLYLSNGHQSSTQAFASGI